MRQALSALFVGFALAAGPACAETTLRADGDQLMPDGQQLVVAKGASLRSVEWKQHEIPVCWIQPAPEDAAARAMVRQSVRETWEAAANVRITGWESCEERSGSRKMVRIHVADEEWPRAVVGKNALSKGTPTMHLNFHLSRRAGFASCASREERCLRFTAVHEFGHMLGLIHEQDRPETPSDCIAGLAPGQRQTPDMSDIDLLTGYDPDSLMNYCSTRGYDPHQPLTLSSEDAASIRKLFGDPLSAGTTNGRGIGRGTPEQPRDAKPSEQGRRKRDRPLFDPN